MLNIGSVPIMPGSDSAVPSFCFRVYLACNVTSLIFTRLPLPHHVVPVSWYSRSYLCPITASPCHDIHAATSAPSCRSRVMIFTQLPLPHHVVPVSWHSRSYLCPSWRSRVMIFTQLHLPHHVVPVSWYSRSYLCPITSFPCHEIHAATSAPSRRSCVMKFTQLPLPHPVVPVSWYSRSYLCPITSFPCHDIHLFNLSYTKWSLASLMLALVGYDKRVAFIGSSPLVLPTGAFLTAAFLHFILSRAQNRAPVSCWMKYSRTREAALLRWCVYLSYILMWSTLNIRGPHLSNNGVAPRDHASSCRSAPHNYR